MSGLLVGLGALFQATSRALDKFVLSSERVEPRVYLGVSFIFIFFIDLVLFFGTGAALSETIFQGKFLALMGASVILGIIVNAVYYSGLAVQKLTEVEPITLFGNATAVLIAGFLIHGEHDLPSLLLTLLAISAVIWAHLERRHLVFDRYMWCLFLWSLVGAPLSVAVNRELLRAYSPIALEAVRTALMMPFFLFIMRKNELHAHLVKRSWAVLFLLNLLSAVAFVLLNFGYQTMGIIETTLLWMLTPLFVYVFATVFLGEKLRAKNAAAFSVVILSIVALQIFS